LISTKLLSPSLSQVEFVSINMQYTFSICSTLFQYEYTFSICSTLFQYEYTFLLQRYGHWKLYRRRRSNECDITGLTLWTRRTSSLDFKLKYKKYLFFSITFQYYGAMIESVWDFYIRELWLKTYEISIFGSYDWKRMRFQY